MTAVRDLRDLPENVECQEVAPGLVSIGGVVDSHQERKMVENAVVEALEKQDVMNELYVRSSKRTSVRQVLASLAKDPGLDGIRFYHRHPRYKPLFHVHVSLTEDATVTISGQLPRSEDRSYLEAQLWTSPGVERVINLTKTPGKRDDVCVDKVVRSVIEQDAKLPSEVKRHLRVEPKSDSGVVLRGRVANQTLLRRLERDAWAVPEVQQVDSCIMAPTA